MGTRYVKQIIIHCSATRENQDIKAATIKEWHLKNGWKDIGYHYIIDLDGTIERGRSMQKIGAHCEGHNTGTIGICYIGGVAADGKTPKDTRTDAQKKALVWLVRQLMDIFGLAKYDVHCHNEYSNKACPSFKIGTFRNEL